MFLFLLSNVMDVVYWLDWVQCIIYY